MPIKRTGQTNVAGGAVALRQAPVGDSKASDDKTGGGKTGSGPIGGASSSTSVQAVVDGHDARHAGATAALRALALQTKSPEIERAQNGGAAAATLGAKLMGFAHVEFREGILEEMPVENGWADVVISNGVINLCADKKLVFGELWRVLRPGGSLQFADIANGKPVPESAVSNIDLWTA